MTLVDVIQHRRQQYETKYKYSPQNVYLGEAEYVELMAQKLLAVTEFTPTKYLGGLRVIRVLEDTHIGFGIGN